MHSDLQQLLGAPLSRRSLYSLTRAAMKAAESSRAPLGYFVIASLAANMATHDAGGPVSADAANVRDEIIRPLLVDLVEAIEADDHTRLVAAANAAISASLLTR